MKTISASELNIKLKNKEVCLVDVREPAEHRSEHISGARLIPLSEIKPTDFSNDRVIVFHCKSGKRSLEACSRLISELPTHEIFSLQGGIEGWKACGYDVIKSTSNFLPLDRQTQIVIGSITLIGSIIGLEVDPIFFILPIFMGSGLIFAGITGWCGMAKLLAKMPWNK